MKKSLWILSFFTLICIFLLSGCNSNNGHVHAFEEWTIIKDASCTVKGERKSVCSCGKKVTESIAALGHDEVADVAIATTCTENGKTEGKHCARCDEVLVPQTTVEALGHQAEIIDAVAPTCTKWGASGKQICTACQTVLSEQNFIEPIGHTYVKNNCSTCKKSKPDFTDIAQYKSDEGYKYFDTLSNGSAMKLLYDNMEIALTAFHNSSTLNAPYHGYYSDLGYVYAVANFYYYSYGLTAAEAQTVWAVFRKDHPAFYWMAYYLEWTSTYISVFTVQEYANGADRSRYNELMYQNIEKYASLVEGETSAYKIALTYYDAIMKNNEYAYNSSGKSETAQWAHSIMGGFVYKKFVCEGYAKLFQLLLNYSNIKNMHIMGYAGESHVWNTVCMDNGQWYLFDITWGDTVTDNSYKYFCATDDAFTTHVPTTPNQPSLYFNGSIPEIADTSFESDAIWELGEKISVDGCIYYLVSADTVKIENGSPTSTSDDKIVYQGAVYNVIQ